MPIYTEEYGPNVSKILFHGSRIIRARIPAQVRAELRAAVKAGVLGHLKRDGLKPEIFFQRDHLHLARDLQNKEAAYSLSLIAGVVAHGAERAEHDFAVLTR